MRDRKKIRISSGIAMLLATALLAGCGSPGQQDLTSQTSGEGTSSHGSSGADVQSQPSESSSQDSDTSSQETDTSKQESEGNIMTQERINTAMQKAREYIDDLTIHSTENVPAEIVADIEKFFTWDNEKRMPGAKPYLYDWSYYNGVVMEGLYDIYEADPQAGGAYLDYVKEYLDAMIETDQNGHKSLNPELAGYVDYHGADCYKTAALLVRVGIHEKNQDYLQICQDLYRDLTDASYTNTSGHIVPVEYTESALGHNYWHSWANDKAPQYKVWLDGIYMLQPFISHYAAETDDKEQLALVQERLSWVKETLLAEDGMYWHAANSKDDLCKFHWTRAMGWYGMAMVDVMEVLPEEYMEERKEALKIFVDGVLQYQDESGLWANVADWDVTETNRLEVSGTSMIVYTILKGVRSGWLDESYRDAAIKAFVGMTEQKLDGDGLHDIYFKASANNTDNYQDTQFYLTDEGKGAGPFIMAYSEMLKMK